MHEDKTKVQAEMGRAERDLENKLGQLKALIAGKLEMPRRVAEAVKKPVAWTQKHPLAILRALSGMALIKWLTRRMKLGRGSRAARHT